MNSQHPSDTPALSLNKMVLDTLNNHSDKSFLTAREIKSYLLTSFGMEYQIQTIIVVLNRFCAKGLVNRCTFAGPEVRERYGYYMATDSVSFRDEKLKERLHAIATEFFSGSDSDALTALNHLVTNP